MSGPSGSQKMVKFCFYFCQDLLSITEAAQALLVSLLAPSEPLQSVGEGKGNEMEASLAFLSYAE